MLTSLHDHRVALPALPALLVMLGALLLLACSGSSKPKAVPSPTTAPYQASFEDAACSFSLPDGQPVEKVRCGFLTVPENRVHPEARSVKLAAAVLKSTAAEPQPDPIVYLSGGPGGPALTSEMQGWDSQFAAPFQSKRDIVFFDQRGTGLSRPGLYCPEVRKNFLDSLALNESGGSDADEANPRRVAAVLACREHLVADGTELSAYSSAESAADIADLMAALGYGDYNLFGVSYGTRLALTAMRDRPQHLRSVVLDSTLSLQANGNAERARNFERALDTLLSGCKADAACDASFPQLETMFFDLVAKLNREPIVVEPRDPATGTVGRVVVTGDRLMAGVWQALYDTSLLGILPFAIDSIAHGNNGILELLAESVVFRFDDFADGMSQSVNCNEEIPFTTAQIVADDNKDVRKPIVDGEVGTTNAASTKRLLDLCAAWGTPAPDARENEAVSSDIPTLVLAGEYDPVTPPAWGKLAAVTLSRSYFFQFPGVGHGVMFAGNGRHGCAVAIFTAFIDDPSHSPDGSCIATVPPLAFQTR